MKKILLSRWIQPVLLLVCLGPILSLTWKGTHGDGLGANPIEYITHATGEWTLRFLVFTLLITPLRQISGQPALIRFRRTLGLFAFLYGCLHFVTYIWLDKFFDLREVVADIWKRPYITVGFLGFVLMAPLAATSFSAAIRWLGGKRWQALHRLIYITAICGVVHYYWLVKSDVRWPLAYGAMIAILLGYRLRMWWRKPTVAARAPVATRAN